MNEYIDLMNKQNAHIEELNKDEILQYVQKSGGQIIAGKGATFYAIAMSVCQICRILLSSNDSIVTASSMLHGEYGIDDVCLSILTLTGPNGVRGKLPVALTDEEHKKLCASADLLKSIIKQINLY